MEFLLYLTPIGSENVGLSSEKMGENPIPRNPKGSSGRLVRGGLVRT